MKRNDAGAKPWRDTVCGKKAGSAFCRRFTYRPTWEDKAEGLAGVAANKVGARD